MWCLGPEHSPIASGSKTIAASVVTEILTPDSRGPGRAAQMLRDGELVAFGTETVYGLGADARNGVAVARIYQVKGRPVFNPLIVHVADLDAASQLIDIPPSLHPLTGFWPGPLTLVGPCRPDSGIASLVTAGLPTLAVRVPSNPGAQALLRAFDGPVAAPSANTSGLISPSRASHVQADLGGRIAAILDTGPCTVGLESTIVGLGSNGPALLRPGGISQEALVKKLGHPLAGPPVGTITAPGQLASHYAPKAALTMDVTAPGPDMVMIGFGALSGTLNLSPNGDVTEAAANLFECLHQADATGQPIGVAPIPNIGLGRAINDRLHRAAASKS